MCKEKNIIIFLILSTCLLLFGGFEYNSYYVDYISGTYSNTFSHNLGGVPTLVIPNAPDYVTVSYSSNSSSVNVTITVSANQTGDYRSGVIGIEVHLGGNQDGGSFQLMQACQACTNSVQSTIDQASNGDVINLSGTTYEGPLTISNKYVTIIGDGTVIKGSGHNSVITLNNASGTELKGLRISNGHYDHGAGIYCQSSDVLIEDCIIEGNVAHAFYSGGLIFESYGGGVYDLGDSDIEMSGCLLYHNYALIGNNIYRQASSSDIELDKCTLITWNYDNIYNSGSSQNFVVTNSIVDNPDLYLNDFNYTYCHAFDTQLTTFPGTGNDIISDPMFVDASNNDYHLLWGSPCIDDGNPGCSLDDDYSVTDVGCFSYERDQFNIDTSSRYHWYCFPRLDVDDNNNNGENDDYLYPDNAMDAFWSIVPAGIEVYFENQLKTEGTSYLWNLIWNPSDYKFYSYNGLKFATGTNSEFYIGGYLMDPDYVFDDLPAMQESWLGYFLEETQDIGDAISSGDFDDLLMIKTQSWSLSRSSINDPWIGYCRCKVNYGDLVIIVPETTVQDFQWQSSSRGNSEPYFRPKAEHFEWVDEMDYLPIYAEFDFANMPEEIAVYVNGVCKGAQVVEDTICQICAYVLEEEPGNEIEFVFYDGERKQSKSNVTVLDNKTGKAKGNKLVTGKHRDFCRVSFKENYEVPLIEKYNILCSPNPFNPETFISFDLEEAADVKLGIYNVKGQKIKTLVDEFFRKGSYKISWDGSTASGNSAVSGIYFYRVEIGNDIVNGKVIMLK